jgi:hypothetical protein
MAKEQKTKDTKKYYFSKEDLDTFKTKDAVAEYLNGIIHQDKMFYIMAVVLPKLGFDQSTPFRLIDVEGKPSLETGKTWVAFEVPSDITKIKEKDKNEQERTSSAKGTEEASGVESKK